jgi:sulfate adenylyltransferase subunit 1
LGDNVVDRSINTPWYDGKTLMETLESVNIDLDHNYKDGRFPVQYVIRPHSEQFHDFRGYAGRVEGGVFKPGDEVVVLPSGLKTKVSAIESLTGPLKEAFPPMSITMTLADNIDISRGDMIVKADNLPQVSQEVELMICWMADKKLIAGGKYVLKHTTKDLRCIVKEVKYKVNISNLEEIHDNKEVGLNDIARIFIKTTAPIFFDSYSRNRATGSVILIDEFTNETVGAGMII